MLSLVEINFAQIDPRDCYFSIERGKLFYPFELRHLKKIFPNQKMFSSSSEDAH